MGKIKTLFISDIHLGSKNSQAKKLLEVLKENEFENLIIVGDFIDMTALKRKFYWNQDHSNIIQKVLKLSRKGTNVIYIIGNHDYYIRTLIEEGSINIGNILICDEYIYETIKGERIYITHGDCFDGFIRMHKFLYALGDKAYYFSISINKIYNGVRKVFGFEYWSLSQYLKSKVKNAISFINNFKILSMRKLEETNCDSIMIGHIHTPAIDKIGNKNYYNTGDMVESLSYIIEDLNGNIKLLYC
jgi:UDP-2,3-diacylglucosamine pyrophosphatase LpxH